jgi:hypothetical protein
MERVITLFRPLPCPIRYGSASSSSNVTGQSCGSGDSLSIVPIFM